MPPRPRHASGSGMTSMERPNTEVHDHSRSTADGMGTASGRRRRRDELQVTCVSDDCDEEVVQASEWLGDTGACQGDSGGPALDAENRVAGVVSRGALDCGFPIYGSTFSWSAWLKDTVVHASGMGLYTAPAWTAGSLVDPRYSMPIGETCSSDVDCPTGHCIEDAGGLLCTRPCNDASPCPSDYRCESRGGVDLCVDDSPPPPPAFKRAEYDDGCHVAAPSERIGWRGVGPVWIYALLWRWRRRRCG